MMTEVEWLNCGEWRMMLNYLDDRLTERKVRLFAAAGFGI
jgi:hypothetical protein